MYPGYRSTFTLGLKKHDVRKSTLDEQEQEIRKRVKKFNEGAYSNQEEVVTLTGDKLERYQKFLAMEKDLGRSLVNFLEDEVLPARRTLEPLKVSLTSAAKDYVDRHAVKRRITVSGAVNLYLGVKAGNGVKKAISEKQQDRYRGILGYLSAKYGHKQMSEIKPVQVQAFLRGLSRQKAIQSRKRDAEKQLNKKGII